jgi:hypothetical protein
MKPAARLLLLGTWLALTTRVAAAQELVDPVTTTAISGYGSNEVTWLNAGMSGSGLYAVSWSEAADKPCFMVVARRSLSNNGQLTDGVSDILNGCGGTSSTKTASFEQHERYFIRGLAVCTNNNDNHRLKGVRIYAAKVWLTKQDVQTLSVSEEASRTNCATWHAAVYCPAGTIAAAIVVHPTGASPNIEITGLALRCKKVHY